MLANHLDGLLYAASSKPEELTPAVERFKADNRAVEEAKALVGILSSAGVLPNGFGDVGGAKARIAQLEFELANLIAHPLVPSLPPPIPKMERPIPSSRVAALQAKVEWLTNDLNECKDNLKKAQDAPGEVTSPEIAALASKILSNKKSTVDERRIAASVLTQARNKK